MAMGGVAGHVRRAEDAMDRVGAEPNVITQPAISDMLPVYSAVAHVVRKVSGAALPNVDILDIGCKRPKRLTKKVS